MDNIILVTIIIIFSLIILYYNFDMYEHLTDTCSNYSFGNVSCLIACKDRKNKLNKKCFRNCVDNSVIY
jgi:hypothetical protein